MPLTADSGSTISSSRQANQRLLEFARQSYSVAQAEESVLSGVLERIAITGDGKWLPINPRAEFKFKNGGLQETPQNTHSLEERLLTTRELHAATQQDIEDSATTVDVLEEYAKALMYDSARKLDTMCLAAMASSVRVRDASTPNATSGVITPTADGTDTYHYPLYAKTKGVSNNAALTTIGGHDISRVMDIFDDRSAGGKTIYCASTARLRGILNRDSAATNLFNTFGRKEASGRVMVFDFFDVEFRPVQEAKILPVLTNATGAISSTDATTVEDNATVICRDIEADLSENNSKVLKTTTRAANLAAAKTAFAGSGLFSVECKSRDIAWFFTADAVKWTDRPERMMTVRDTLQNYSQASQYYARISLGATRLHDEQIVGLVIAGKKIA